MKRKNFTSIPNEFFIDETTNKNNLELDYRHEYVFIKLQACQAKWGKNFQKSLPLMAKICNMSQSTFERISNELINRGLITKIVTKVEGSKNSNPCIWTVNYEYIFEFEENEQNEDTYIQNDMGVSSKRHEGNVNMTMKKDVLKDSKELEEEEKNNIYNNARFDYFFNLQENKGISDILNNKGFSHDTIMSIRKLCAEQKIYKELRPNIIELAVKNYYKDKAKGLEIERPANFFVYKLKESAQQILEKVYENEQREKAMLEQEKIATKKLPFYNWLEA